MSFGFWLCLFIIKLYSQKAVFKNQKSHFPNRVSNFRINFNVPERVFCFVFQEKRILTFLQQSTRQLLNDSLK